MTFVRKPNNMSPNSQQSQNIRKNHQNHIGMKKNTLFTPLQKNQRPPPNLVMSPPISSSSSSHGLRPIRSSCSQLDPNHSMSRSPVGSVPPWDPKRGHHSQRSRSVVSSVGHDAALCCHVTLFRYVFTPCVTAEVTIARFETRTTRIPRGQL